MFKNLTPINPDPILGLVEEFNADQRENKINLTIGVYANEVGEPAVFKAVRVAEKAIYDAALNKVYLPIKGSEQFLLQVARHVLGDFSEQVVTCYGSGGTGALRLAAEVMRMASANQRIWISVPTWENHINLFKHCGFQIHNYAWLDQKNQLMFDNLIAEIWKNGQQDDWVLLHGCCHNPSGIDPNHKQWLQLFTVLQAKGMKPIFDIAYHGYSKNITEDLRHVHDAMQIFNEVIICYSFSKIMGLYNDRCGALMIKSDELPKTTLNSNIQRMARLLFSNPPAFGLRIAEYIMSSPELRQLWLAELTVQQSRLAKMRQLFVEQLRDLGTCFQHVANGAGMFALLGLNGKQVEQLKIEHGIYLLTNSRINIAGLNEKNIQIVTQAIREVIKS